MNQCNKIYSFNKPENQTKISDQNFIRLLELQNTGEAVLRKQ